MKEYTVLAKFYDKINPMTQTDRLVIHCTESPKRAGAALNVASWFANPWDKNHKKWIKASAHFVVDNVNVVNCVPILRRGYHCRGGNDNSIGIEIVGYAKQTREQWLDTYGIAELDNAATVAARLCVTYSLPVVSLNADAVNRGERGITTHRVITEAKKIAGGHVDPGQHFPLDVLIDKIKAKISTKPL